MIPDWEDLKKALGIEAWARHPHSVLLVLFFCTFFSNLYACDVALCFCDPRADEETFKAGKGPASSRRQKAPPKKKPAASKAQQTGAGKKAPKKIPASNA